MNTGEKVAIVAIVLQLIQIAIEVIKMARERKQRVRR